MSDQFSFAGFQFPRNIPQLVKPDYCGKLAPLTRGAGLRHKFKVSTSYRETPTPATAGNPRGERGFYHDSDFAPGLRWTWADEVSGTRIGHTGWFCNDHGCGDKIRGVVFRLPKGRGFMIGWAMGRKMAATIQAHVYDDEQEAAYAADDLAEGAAEEECEYQRDQQEIEDERERAEHRAEYAETTADLVHVLNNGEAEAYAAELLDDCNGDHEEANMHLKKFIKFLKAEELVA